MRLITMEVSQSYLDGDICSSFTVLDLPDPRESSDRSRFSLSLIPFVRRFTRAFNVDRSSLFAASYAIYFLPPLLFYLSFRTRVNKQREIEMVASRQRNASLEAYAMRERTARFENRASRTRTRPRDISCLFLRDESTRTV